MEILAWTMLGLAFLLNPLTYLAGSARPPSCGGTCTR